MVMCSYEDGSMHIKATVAMSEEQGLCKTVPPKILQETLKNLNYFKTLGVGKAAIFLNSPVMYC